MAETRLEAVMRENRLRQEEKELIKNPKPIVAEPVAAPLSEAVLAGMEAGNINITATGERAELNEIAKEDIAKHERLMTEFENKKKILAITVPTDDIEVKAKLREFNEPICLFGENSGDRRQRLRNLMFNSGITLPTKRQANDQFVEDEEENKKVWYHQGPNELKYARIWIAKYSLLNARERLKAARITLAQPDNKKTNRQILHQKLQEFINTGSQVGDNRPLTYCEFSPNGKLLATGSMSGLSKLWSVPQFDLVRTFRGHSDRIGCISWHPQSTLTLDDSVLNLMSASSDGNISAWSLDSEVALAQYDLKGGRVSRVRFHPSGRFVGATCFDHSWRLMDLETKQEILHQEGHSRPCYDIAFHIDGSLAVTGGHDCHGRVWDLRTGKNVLILQGHIKPILAIDIASNGYHILTGSNDHSVRLWDLREQKSVYTLPAHNNLVSSIKYSADGEFFVTSSYDNTAKVWTAPDCLPLKTLTTTSKIMHVDITKDNQYFATASYDNTFKLWNVE